MAKRGEYKITPQQFKSTIEKYITECEVKNIRPLKSELAYILGIDKDTLTNYRRDPRYIEPLKRLENLSETILNRKMEASANNTNAIFLLKSVHGYIEAQHTQKIDITSNGETLGVVQLPPKKA